MTWRFLMGLPGPSEFFRAVAEDLLERNCVVVGLPIGFSDGLVRQCFGRATQAASSGTCDLLEDRPASSLVSEVVCRRDTGNGLLYIDARSSGESVARDWNAFVRRQARMLDHLPTRVCVVLRESLAGGCRVEKHFRQQLWRDYVTDLDARALTLDYIRQTDHSDEYKASKVSLVGTLCGPDLLKAEQYRQYPLRHLVNVDRYSRHAIWSGQVSALFPLVDCERVRLLRRYHRFWQPKLGDSFLDLEIGDMKRQAAGRSVLARRDYRQICWLKDVRDRLAHMQCVPWAELVSSPIIKFE